MQELLEAPTERDAAPLVHAPAPAPSPAPAPRPDSLAATEAVRFRESPPETAVAVADNAMNDLLDAVVALDRMITSIQATRARVIDAVIQTSALTVSEPSTTAARELRLRSLRAELAAAMRIPERTAERMLLTSELLVRGLPNTLAGLAEGRVSYRHAEALVEEVEEVESLEPVVAADVEAAALPHAEALTVAKFRRKLRVLREITAPGSAVERHRVEVGRREIAVSPARDGMAWLSAYLPAADALGGFNRLTDMATSLLHADEESSRPSRSLAQARADVFVELLHAGEISSPPATVSGIRATVHVTVPVLTLLGHPLPDGTSKPVLEGYGPIDDDTARRLAGTATSFHRILTHPETGAVLSVGRDSYAVPADLRRWLQVRDVTCRFIGCSQPVQRCDVDRSVDWQHGGETAHDNPAHLCRGHHTLKHHTGWSVRNNNGSLSWTSPAGRHYVTEPEIHLRV